MSDFPMWPNLPIVAVVVTIILAIVWQIVGPIVRWIVWALYCVLEPLGDFVSNLLPADKYNPYTFGYSYQTPMLPEDRATQEEIWALQGYREAYPDGYYPALPSETAQMSGDGYARMLPPTE